MGSLGGALGQVGQGIQNLPGNIYEQSGLQNVSQGLQNLFGGGPETVPAADFVGPPSPYQAPNFAQGLMQGILGQQPNLGVDVPTAGGQIGGGLGELIAMLEKMRQQSGGQMGSMVPTPGGATPGGIRMLPGYQQAGAPTGGLIHNLIGAFTYGILGGGIPSSGQV
jgi:hypothetical protein